MCDVPPFMEAWVGGETILVPAPEQGGEKRCERQGLSGQKPWLSEEGWLGGGLEAEAWFDVNKTRFAVEELMIAGGKGMRRLPGEGTSGTDVDGSGGMREGAI
jgi:hypothetical protein